MHQIIIALGSNIGDAGARVRQAMKDLDEDKHISVEECSSLYRSQAMEVPADGEGYEKREQDDYLNAVVVASTSYSPLDLLDALQRMENQHGRVRKQRWGPRILDLDIITYDDQEINIPRLIVPHPDAHRRCFVLLPIAEVLPESVIPGYGRVLDLLPRCSTGKATRCTG